MISRCSTCGAQVIEVSTANEDFVLVDDEPRRNYLLLGSALPRPAVPFADKHYVEHVCPPSKTLLVSELQLKGVVEDAVEAGLAKRYDA